MKFVMGVKVVMLRDVSDLALDPNFSKQRCFNFGFFIRHREAYIIFKHVPYVLT